MTISTLETATIGNAAELRDFLAELEQLHRVDLSTVYLTTDLASSGDELQAALVARSLTDGSIVHDLRLWNRR